MFFAFVAAVVLGLGLSIHPGDSVRRAIRETLAASGAATRLGAVAGAVGAEAAALAVVSLILVALPAALLDAPGFRGFVWIVAAAALGAVGWRRIESSARLDLRRDGLTADLPPVRDPRPWVDAALGAVACPQWHLFWWLAAPGLLLAVSRGGPSALLYFVVVYAAAASLWPVAIAYRVSLGEEKVVRTVPFRVTHSLSGLAIVGLAFVLLVRALREWDLEGVAARAVIQPLFGFLAHAVL